jgi:hypothetical protein
VYAVVPRASEEESVAVSSLATVSEAAVELAAAAEELDLVVDTTMAVERVVLGVTEETTVVSSESLARAVDTLIGAMVALAAAEVTAVETAAEDTTAAFEVRTLHARPMTAGAARRAVKRNFIVEVEM